MVSVYHYADNAIKRLSIKELGQCLRQQDGIIWVDLENPDDAEEETLLVSLFDFHPLSIEDLQRGKEEEGHLPKVEDFAEYLFVILNPVEMINGSSERPSRVNLKTSQLSAFLSARTLVTHH